ncbi:MAG: hypothetical protein ACRKGH_03135 [Dehalogenimonas sp.]
MAKTIVLTVGDKYNFGFGKDRLCYAGMPSENVFSIVRLKWEFMYRGFSWNQFYPTSSKDIQIEGIDIHIEHVNPNEIRLIIG